MYGGLRGGTRPPRENDIARGNEYYALGGNIPRSKLTGRNSYSGVALNVRAIYHLQHIIPTLIPKLLNSLNSQFWVKKCECHGASIEIISLRWRLGIVMPELRNVISFTQSKSFKPKITPRNARKSRQI